MASAGGWREDARRILTSFSKGKLTLEEALDELVVWASRANY